MKWRDQVEKDTALPTPWPKQAYEKHQREYQKIRAKLRKDSRPEAEMNALFHREQGINEKLFMSSENKDRIGAFEGANYESTGYYRSQINCVMFTRSDSFCKVCSDAIESVIDQYSGPSAHALKSP